MTKDEIFKLAEKAGFYLSAFAPECGRIWWSDECPLDEELLRFAALVAAAEREECAQPAHKPLTDEALLKMWDDTRNDPIAPSVFCLIACVRHVERAHGIGSEE